MTNTDRQIATYESNGRFALPSALAQELGIATGSTYEVIVDREEIHLRPIASSPSRKEFDESAIDELRAMFRGGPSLEDDLIASRRENEARRLKKEAEWL